MWACLPDLQCSAAAACVHKCLCAGPFVAVCGSMHKSEYQARTHRRASSAHLCTRARCAWSGMWRLCTYGCVRADAATPGMAGTSLKWASTSLWWASMAVRVTGHVWDTLVPKDAPQSAEASQRPPGAGSSPTLPTISCGKGQQTGTKQADGGGCAWWAHARRRGEVHTRG